jgi:hypothetical protein
MAVQVGRTVISFTIKYVQSEKEKLKSDISKVLDSKNKMIKKPSDTSQDAPMNQPNPLSLNQNLPIEMQQTFAMNIPMENQGP